MLAATQLAGRSVPPGYRPQPVLAPQIAAGPYLAAVEDGGSPGPGPNQLPKLFGRGRAAADGVLTSAYGIALTPATGKPAGQAPPAEGAAAAETTTRGACLRAQPQSASGVVDVAIPPNGLQLAGNAKVYLRRFGDMFPQTALGAVAPGAPVTLKVPADASTAPWHARLALAGPTRICGL